MLNIDGFSESSLKVVSNLLYAEGQENPLEGQCGQKKKREAQNQPRTPAQEQADQQRAQANSGRDTVSSAVRSEAARKAAETRSRCKGGSPAPTSQPG